MTTTRGVSAWLEAGMPAPLARASPGCLDSFVGPDWYVLDRGTVGFVRCGLDRREQSLKIVPSVAEEYLAECR